ncbi:MAG: FAD-binding protein [Acidobacteriota bacterium]|nr:FAD-binding protein [Blastocatellia bacterium]MDW8412260.1 FAD-binding protein [Acidobacteriota bacterium]
MVEAVERICKKLGVLVRYGQLMRFHTAVGVGGEIDCIAYPCDYATAARLVAELESAAVDWRVLGAGSRLLVADLPIARTAVSLKLIEEMMLFDGEKVRVPAGYRVAAIAAATIERGLAGLEKLGYSVGTVGGALRRQDTAEGRILASLVNKVIVARNGRLVELDATEVVFERESLLLGCELQLRRVKRKRRLVRNKLHLRGRPWAVSGPVFLNSAGWPAAELLLKAGLKGSRRGGVRLAPWNCAFLVNDGTATARDIELLIDDVISETDRRLGQRPIVALERW